MPETTTTGTAHSKAPPEQVWAVLDDVPTWSEWGPWNRTRFEAEGAPPPGGVGAIRNLKMGPMTLREQIKSHEPPTRLSYTILSGLPMREYLAEVELAPSADGGTDITWTSRFEAKRGRGPMMKLLLGRAIPDAARRVARQAEKRAGQA